MVLPVPVLAWATLRIVLDGKSSSRGGGEAVHVGSLECGIDRLGLNRRHALVAHVVGDAGDEVLVDAQLGQVGEEFHRPILGRRWRLLSRGSFRAVESLDRSNALERSDGSCGRNGGMSRDGEERALVRQRKGRAQGAGRPGAAP